MAMNQPASSLPLGSPPQPKLSKLFKVSTKTISQWRQQGLVSRRFVFDGGKRVGFLKSSVEKFAARNEERVRRGVPGRRNPARRQK